MWELSKTIVQGSIAAQMVNPRSKTSLIWVGLRVYDKGFYGRGMLLLQQEV